MLDKNGIGAYQYDEKVYMDLFGLTGKLGIKKCVALHCYICIYQKNKVYEIAENM